MTAVPDRLAAALAGRYRLDRELGQGGMATVYLAHDLKHERDVALKVLHEDLGAALGAERFLAEIKTTAKLQHPHILPLLDSGAAGTLLFYVMPYVKGETLRARLERERQLPLDDALRITREVADALQHAHAQGIIHRDIKPENVLLQDGHALVADFGIALAVQQAGSARMTQTGLSLGTPQYMSPEQAMGEKAIDARSDVYALGAVTYEMLTGEAPFTGATVQAIVAKVLTERPVPLSTVRDTVPPGVEATVLRALAKLPADRPASAAAFAAALVDTFPASAPARGHQRTLAHRLRPWVAAAAGLAIGIGGGVLLARRTPVAAADVTMTSLLPPVGSTFAERSSIALSPDGRRLAFVAALADGTRSLWIRRLDRLEPELVPRSTGATAPFWSPDGRALAWFANGSLIVRDADGADRRVCPTADATAGAWGAKETIVFVDRTGVVAVPASGGKCRRILEGPTTLASRVAMLPGGERFLFQRDALHRTSIHTLAGDSVGTIPLLGGAIYPVEGWLAMQATLGGRDVDVYRFDAATLAIDSVPHRLVSEVRNSTGILSFTLGAQALAYLPSTLDRPYLVLDASGVVRDSVRIEGTWGLSTRARAAGPPLVAVGGNLAGLWFYELDASRATRLAMPTLIEPMPGRGVGPSFPAFSSDGRQLAFVISGRTDCAIVIRELATSADRLLARRDRNRNRSSCAAPIDWTPDGTMLLVRSDSVIAFLPVAGGAAPPPIARPGHVLDARVAPDGRRVAYTSDETGRTELYVMSLPAGVPARISLEGGRWPAWSADGRRLWFLTPDGRVQEAPADPAAGTPRTRFAASGWRRTMFEDNGTGFAVLGDGERFLVRQSPSSIALAYVQDWPGLLAQRTARAP